MPSSTRLASCRSAPKSVPGSVRLLATPGFELCTRVAVLRDSDLPFETMPVPPPWAGAHDPDVLLVTQSHPTLEPEVAKGSPDLVRAALLDIDLDVPDPLSPQAVHEVFRSGRKAGPSGPAVSAGPGARHKGAFALALAGHVREARAAGPVTVPEPISRIFDFLYESLPSTGTTDGAGASAASAGVSSPGDGQSAATTE